MTVLHNSDDYLNTLSTLTLPPLHDILLGYEKIAVQISKQNKELSALRELVQKDLSLSHSNEKDELAELKALLKDKEKQVSTIETHLISIIDSVYYMTHAVNESVEFLENSYDLPKDTCTNAPTPCSCQLKQVTRSLKDGCTLIQKKLEAYLKALNISIINPLKGDLFSPISHRAIEQSKGGEPGTIAQVLRIGYKKENTALRFADVKIYIN